MLTYHISRCQNQTTPVVIIIAKVMISPNFEKLFLAFLSVLIFFYRKIRFHTLSFLTFHPYYSPPALPFRNNRNARLPYPLCKSDIRSIKIVKFFSN